MTAANHKSTKVKKHLNAMSKNSKLHRLRTTHRIIKYGTISFTRNVWLSIAATLVMTITLIILFATAITSIILSSTADDMREKIDITIFFKPNTPDHRLESMRDLIKRDQNVKEVEIANSRTEYERFLGENNKDTNLVNTLKDAEMEEIMLNSMQATMRIKVHDINNIDSIKNIVNSNQQFIDNLDSKKPPTYDINRAEIETVTSWANMAKNGGLVLGIIFLVISVLVIFNTIRMAIFSRREEIYMMKLVGADHGFIRGPFLVEAQLCGLISGIIATTIGFFGFKFFAPNLENYGINIEKISSILFSQWLVVVYLVAIFIGILIGTVSARLAIHKHLR